jgi:hypothetical protein
MKTKLLLPIVLFLLFSTTLFSQNTWIGEGTDTNWSNVDNWSAGIAPVPADNVLIPTGFNVNANSLINVSSLTVEGNSTLNIQSGITFASPSVFRQNTTINYFNGIINGQGSILTSEGTINIMITNLFDLSNSTTINNLGTINCVSGFLLINNNSVINNSGTIDFKTNGFQISRAGSPPYVLNNTGLIKTSFPDPSDVAFIACQLINTGTIQVETGTLNLNNSAVNLAGGLYNVAAGAALNWNSPTTVSGILTGNVFGDLNWNDDLIVPTTVFFDFDGNQTINCTGNLEGGGTLTNHTTINQIGGASLLVDGATTLDNEGIIQITSGPGFAIGTNSIINNNASGVIDIQVNGADINATGGFPNVLNNSGLIRATFQNPTDQSIFSAQLNNNNGTIQVDNGTLWLFNSNTTFTDGIYNIATGATLQWTLPITISGALNGALDGALGWEGDLLVPTSASFNFTGSGSIEWATNSLTGGGTLTNEHVITTVNGPNKIINGATTLINNSEIKSTGFVRIGTDSALSNSVTGTIDIEAFGSSFGTIDSAPHTFINSGILIASFLANATFISAPINNFGIIEVTTAEIDFSNTLINETSGIIRGAGTIDLPSSANFINNGTFSPGLSPGVLSVLGDYPSATSSILNIELNGLTQGSEYDLLAINGGADLDGTVQITLGFSPNVNDEFIIAMTSGTINTCNIPVTAMASFDGFNYGFDVACRNNDELVLTVSEQTLGVDEETGKFITHVYPNPATNVVHIEASSDIESIKVFDISGKLILTKNSNIFSIENLSKGIYIIEVTDFNGKALTQKLVKK